MTEKVYVTMDQNFIDVCREILGMIWLLTIRLVEQSIDVITGVEERHRRKSLSSESLLFLVMINICCHLLEGVIV